MGTRTIFRVLDCDKKLVATLFANSSHASQFAEKVFEELIRDRANRAGPNALVEKLIAQRYQTSEGNHRAGDRVFWLVPADEVNHGDREAVVTVAHGGAAEELEPETLVPLAGPAWSYERTTVS